MKLTDHTLEQPDFVRRARLSWEMMAKLGFEEYIVLLGGLGWEEHFWQQEQHVQMSGERGKH